MGTRSKTHVGWKSRKPPEPQYKMIHQPVAIGVGVGLVIALVLAIYMTWFQN
jgi:hypothetical protein